MPPGEGSVPGRAIASSRPLGYNDRAPDPPSGNVAKRGGSVSRHPEPRRPARIVPQGRPGRPPRLLADLSASDDRALARAVARLTPEIERSLGRYVVANRASGRGDLVTVRLEPWLRARQRWSRIVQGIACDRWLVRADVERFYTSLREPALRATLPADVDDVLAVLKALWEDGVTGLPVGPEASAILANGVLAPVDHAIRVAGGIPLRWVDDWLVPTSSAAQADRVLVSIERALRELGLRMNPTKTRVFAPRDAARILTPHGCAGSSCGRAMMPAP